MLALARRFVCARMVKMDGVDLEQFQFDYDLTWAAFFLNADGTVYARYGSRDAEGPMVTNSTAGLLRTMERVLEAHAAYPANAELFAAKRGPRPAYRRPEDIPSAKTRRSGPVSRGNCIHCHNVHEAFHDAERAAGEPLPRKLFKYPFPRNAGIEVDELTGARVERVLPASPAAAAGIDEGDVVEVLDGQAILSLADIQFVLHHLPDGAATLRAVVRRGEERIERTLALEGEWRRNDFTWRVSMAGIPPDSGFYLHALDAKDKERLGIDARHVALEVRDVFEPAARRSGLEKGDVIIGYDGKRERLGAVAFQNYLRIHHYRSGSVAGLDVLRGGKTVSVEWTR